MTEATALIFVLIICITLLLIFGGMFAFFVWAKQRNSFTSTSATSSREAAVVEAMNQIADNGYPRVLITFRVNGRQVHLPLDPVQANGLMIGSRGILTWRNDRFVNFERH